MFSFKTDKHVVTQFYIFVPQYTKKHTVECLKLFKAVIIYCMNPGLFVIFFHVIFT